jgi:hypothetical protein
MLLGFIVSERGIKANPEKITAITKMGPIRDLKGAKGHGLPCGPQSFYLAPRQEGAPSVSSPKEIRAFFMDPEPEEALSKLKATLAKPPILVPPAIGESLLLYVAATTQVVSATIVVKRTEEGHALPVQRPVYFISEVLSDTKVCYP